MHRSADGTQMIAIGLEHPMDTAQRLGTDGRGDWTPHPAHMEDGRLVYPYWSRPLLEHELPDIACCS